MLPVKTKTPLVMRIGLHDEGLVLLTPEIPGEPSEAVRQERGGNGLKRIRGFAHSGDSFRRSRFRRASGGPIFSVLPEKMGGEKGRWGTFGAYCGYGFVTVHQICGSLRLNVCGKNALRSKFAGQYEFALVLLTAEAQRCSCYRGKDPRKPKRFSWSVQGGPGGNRNPPGLK